MNHLTMFLSCVFSVEIFLRLNFLSILDSIYVISNKALHLVTKKNVSDHWKEKVLPKYALEIIKLSFQILLIIFCIFSLFFIANIFNNNFFLFFSSYFGIIESILFGVGYFYLRELFIK